MWIEASGLISVSVIDIESNFGNKIFCKKKSFFSTSCNFLRHLDYII